MLFWPIWFNHCVPKEVEKFSHKSCSEHVGDIDLCAVFMADRKMLMDWSGTISFVFVGPTQLFSIAMFNPSSAEVRDCSNYFMGYLKKLQGVVLFWTIRLRLIAINILEVTQVIKGCEPLLYRIDWKNLWNNGFWDDGTLEKTTSIGFTGCWKKVGKK